MTKVHITFWISIFMGMSVGIAAKNALAQSPATEKKDSVVPTNRRMSEYESGLAQARVMTYGNTRLQEAAALYRSLLAQMPGDTDLLTELAAVYMRLQELEKALPLLEQVAMQDPGNYPVRLHAGQCQLWLNQTERAIKTLELLSGSFPTKPEPYLYLSEAYSSTGSHQRAIAAARKFADLNGPKHSASSVALGNANFAAGNFTEAAGHLERGLARLDKSAATGIRQGLQRSLGLALSWTGEEDRALSLLQDAAVAFPKDTQILLAIARIHAHRNEPHITQPILQKILALDSTNREVLVEAADIDIALGHYHAALELYKKALAARPGDEVLALQFADRARSWGDFDLAETRFAQHLRRHPADVIVRRKLAELLVSSDRVEEANAIYRSIGPKKSGKTAAPVAEPSKEIQTIKELGLEAATAADFVSGLRVTHAGNARALTNWAEAYFGNERTDLALQFCLAAFEADSAYVPAEFVMAEVLTALERYEEAMVLYDRLLRTFNGNFKLSMGRARALAFSRRYIDAISSFEAVFERNGNNYPALREAARTATWAKMMPRAQELYARISTVKLEDPVREEGFSQVKQAVALEAKAKLANWERRSDVARGLYDDLLTAEPRNKEALFDRAQIACAAGRAEESIAYYEQLVAIDPLHTTARDAKQELLTRKRPRFVASGNVRSEDGRGELAKFDRSEYSAGVETVVSEGLALSVLATSWQEKPDGTSKTFDSLGPTLQLAWHPSPKVRSTIRWSGKFYDDNLSSRHVGAASLWSRLSEQQSIGGGYERNDEISNRFGLVDGTQSDALWLGTRTFLARDIEAFGTARRIFYTDSNEGQHYSVGLTKAFSEEPRVFKVGVAGEYRDTADENIYISDGSGVVDIVHPYWTPQEYFSPAITADWTHDLEEVLFCGQRRHYYRLLGSGYGATDGNAGGSLSIEWGIDLPANLGVGLKATIERSQLYDAEQASLFLRYSF